MIDRKVFQGDVYIYKIRQDEEFVVYFEDGEIKIEDDDGQLTFLQDRDGFYKAIYDDENLLNIFEVIPTARFYGIWDEMFIVTDFSYPIEGGVAMMPFDYYYPICHEYGLRYRLPLCKLYMPTVADIRHAFTGEGHYMLKNHMQQIFQAIQVNDTTRKV